MKDILGELAQARLADTVKKQIEVGVPNVPSDQLERAISILKDVPLNKIRGLVLAVTYEKEDPIQGQGLGVDVLCVGTGRMLEDLTGVLLTKVEATTSQHEEGVCLDCGQDHASDPFAEFFAQMDREHARQQNPGVSQLLAALVLGSISRRG